MKIPLHILQWFAHKKWTLFSFQKKMFTYYKNKKSILLIAPTGSGKTLASFLPLLADVNSTFKGLHTVYISPLKALTYDIERNLLMPIEEMKLNIKVETRTGDTSSYRRKRQLSHPPHILLTTPESLMLLLSYPNARVYFSTLKTVIIDELHTFISSERGDFTALALARLKTFSPFLQTIGLSATAGDPEPMALWIHASSLVKVKTVHKPVIKILQSFEKIPYAGYRATYAIPAIYQTLLRYNLTLIFVNTRRQAEIIFNLLWEHNIKNMPIAIYHGALSKSLRLKTEALALSGKLRAIVTTSALELGIDWGNIDCVMQIGAPKSINRLLQRIGRSNHHATQKSVAYLIPANAFEAVECQAAINMISADQRDDIAEKNGAAEIIIQYIMNCACSEKISPEEIYREVISAYPYRDLSFSRFENLFQFVIDGGYVMKHYKNSQRLQLAEEGRYEVTSPRAVIRHRQNIGVIVDGNKVRVRRLNKKHAKIIGEISEQFVSTLRKGDTFLLGGRIYEFIRGHPLMIDVKKSVAKKPKLPSYGGGQLSLTTTLAKGVLNLIQQKIHWRRLPLRIQEWLNVQAHFSALPSATSCLVETFRYKKTYYMLIYTFKGSAINNTLGAVLTDVMERQNLKPLGFTVTDYGLAINSVVEINPPLLQNLWNNDILASELEQWIWNSSLLKNVFRQIAMIAGLVEKRTAGAHKTLKQLTFSTDLIFDVLKNHEPNHILLTLAYEKVKERFANFTELKAMLHQFDAISFQSLKTASPFSLPILFSYRTEKNSGSGLEELLSEHVIEESAERLLKESKHYVDAE